MRPPMLAGPMQRHFIALTQSAGSSALPAGAFSGLGAPSYALGAATGSACWPLRSDSERNRANPDTARNARSRRHGRLGSGFMVNLPRRERETERPESGSSQ